MVQSGAASTVLDHGFQKYPHGSEAHLHVARARRRSKGHVKAQKVVSKEKQAPRPPLHAQRGRRESVGGERRGGGGLLAVGAVARRVLCNQSCFGASESTKHRPLTDRYGIQRVQVPLGVVFVHSYLSEAVLCVYSIHC
jgi:hypothetical protein